MKAGKRSRSAMTGRDIALSWLDARWGLGMGALAFAAAAMQYQASLGPAAEVRPIPPLCDYLLSAFAGSRPPAPGSGVPFELPAVWFALVFFCVHTCALFPRRLTRGMGAGRFIQAGSRLRWWGRLAFLVVCWCGAYVLLGLLCMAALGAVRYGACPMGAGLAGMACVVFLTLCVLSELQAVFSVLASPAAGELVLTALMVCAAFQDHPALWPRYSMLLRSAASAADGFSCAGASIYLALSFLAVFGLGALLVQKSDFLSVGKGR